MRNSKIHGNQRRDSIADARFRNSRIIKLPVSGQVNNNEILILFTLHNDTNKDDCRPRWQSTIIGGASNNEILILFMLHNDTNKDDCRPQWQSTIIGGASNSEILILFMLHNDTTRVIANGHAFIFNEAPDRDTTD